MKTLFGMKKLTLCFPVHKFVEEETIANTQILKKRKGYVH